MTDEGAVAEAFAQIGSRHSSGWDRAGTVMDLEVSAARALFKSKYWGQYHCVKNGAPHLPATGSIVLFSGWISCKPMAGT